MRLKKLQRSAIKSHLRTSKEIEDLGHLGAFNDSLCDIESRDDCSTIQEPDNHNNIMLNKLVLVTKIIYPFLVTKKV